MRTLIITAILLSLMLSACEPPCPPGKCGDQAIEDEWLHMQREQGLSDWENERDHELYGEYLEAEVDYFEELTDIDAP